MKLKPKHKIYEPINKLLRKGGTLDDVYALSAEFEVTKEEVDQIVKRQNKNVASSFANYAGKEELEKIYLRFDETFIVRYPHLVIFFRGENYEFYEYLEGVYLQISEQDIYNRVDETMCLYSLHEYRATQKRVKDTIRRIVALLSRTNDRHFDAEGVLLQKWYLNLKNGLFDMESFSLKEHTPFYFSTIQVGYKYDPEAICPQFENFIDIVSNKSKTTASMIQEMYGYCLSDGNPMHKVFYLYGDTARNGKSTTAKILCGLIGWQNVSSLTLDQIGNESSSIMTSLVSKQINFSDEISSKYVESSKLTAVSAEGFIEINPKYKTPFLYAVKAKFIVACNDLPRFGDFQGMKHRMITIPFEYHLKPEERIVRYEQVLLEKEGAGILNWAICGYKKLKENGNFTINEESKEDTMDNVHLSYPVYAYLDTRFEFNEKYDVPFSIEELYGEKSSKETPATGYWDFCDRNGLKINSSFTFARELKRYAKETNKVKQVRINYKRKYIGLRPIGDAEADQELENLVNEANL